jgi:cyclic beta-1,2-glucan synthetase
MTDNNPSKADSNGSVLVFDSHVQVDTLMQRARKLSESHTITSSAGQFSPKSRKPLSSYYLTAYLEGYRKLVKDAVRYFRSASEHELAVSYSAEWILDNYYVVLQTFRQIQEDLPKKYHDELPKLASGNLRGFPRIFSIAREIILIGGAMVDLDEAADFIREYEVDNPLTMGELWALPIMLRLNVVQALVTSLYHVTGIKLYFADQPAAVLDLSAEYSDEEVIANGIISLRRIGVEDWNEIIENLSQVEQILSRDPAGIYPQMDFNTRDRYRNVIEKYALGSGLSEQEVAQRLLLLAETADMENPDQISSHVGYYLLAQGRARIEDTITYRPDLQTSLKRWIYTNPAKVYLPAIGICWAVILAILIGYAAMMGGSPWQLLIAGLLGSIPSLTIAVDLVNWVVTNTVKPWVLPKMDFSKGIPAEFSSLVVVPALLSSSDEIESLLQLLELHYLRNPDPNLCFALLTDFNDSEAQHLPEDESLIQQVVAGIELLNERYTRSTPSPFLLLHRERRWNPKEGVWMGWERKRGKLHELNRLILGDKGTSFSVKIGALSVLPDILFVITLDADTILPGNSAHRLIATLAHPLNRAVFSDNGRITAGYSILQPRTQINPSSANRSYFTRIYSGDTGLDLYTLAVSDVYQDLFGEGIFVGKGIYDVRAFERSLEGRVPENSLLSHDLFEGIFGRTALITDVVLIEDYPPHYLAYAHRMHRWVRGDWQLLPWLFGRHPAVSLKDPSREYGAHPHKRRTLSAINRWKIADNLRRSLMAPVLFGLFIAGWTILPGSPIFWTLAGLLSLAAPALTTLFGQLRTKLGRTGFPGAQVKDSFSRWLFSVAFLPYEALLNLDAILVTLWRVYVARRHLLRWKTSAHTARIFSEEMETREILRNMAYAFVLSLLLFVLILLVNPDAIFAAVPILLLWVFSPEIAHRLNAPMYKAEEELTESEKARIRSLARRTWLFFEQYLGPEDHWLPPDHYQEFPRGMVAHRTSPTNIGIGMLCTLGAYDLGYLGLVDLAARLRSMFENLGRLEKIQGHFLNWYDTRSLEPLPPRYVSTVDSGNFAASLIALGQGCLALKEAPVLRWETWQGLLDTLVVMLETLESDGELVGGSSIDALRVDIASLRGRVSAARDNPEMLGNLVIDILDGELLGKLDQNLLGAVEKTAHLLDPQKLNQLARYSRSFRKQLEASRREFELLIPWIFAQSRKAHVLPGNDLPDEIRAALSALDDICHVNPPLSAVSDISRKGLAQLEKLQQAIDRWAGPSLNLDNLKTWANDLADKLESSAMISRVLQIGFEDFHRQCAAMVQEMDFRFLFSKQRKVFHIGYNVDLGRLDNNFYDLLASEARIASMIAMAKGDVPLSHWLHLSRPLTQVDNRLALLSWSATMFEYLMPLLFFRSYEGTILHQSAMAAVDRQISYGQQQSKPWGISESGYYHLDVHQNYQYRAFGVPGLGYKRGLREDLVFAPYASLLALPIRAKEVVRNMEALKKLRMMGTYGFYEAVDFTVSRLPLRENHRIVRSYMAHHQGMILLSLVNYLKDNLIVERVHADPKIQSVDLLLQEHIPQQAPLEQLQTEDGAALYPEQAVVEAEPWKVPVRPPQPRLQYLSNGRFSTAITSSGSGFLTWQDIHLTRWRPDTTLDQWGLWIYLSDLESGDLWSVGDQPVKNDRSNYDVYFNAHLVHFRRQFSDISVDMLITVAPEDDVEIRRITLTNHLAHPRRIQIFSYGEICLAPQQVDERHPAFNKLFIQSEFLKDKNVLVFSRRLRSSDEEQIFLAHALSSARGEAQSPQYETSREHFIGRGRTARFPRVFDQFGNHENVGSLSQTTGATLDPVMVLGQVIELKPQSRVELAYLTGAGSSKQEVLAAIDRYSKRYMLDRVFDQARSIVEVDLHRIGVTSRQLANFQRLLSVLLYPHKVLRAEAKTLAANKSGQPGLWVYGISGDYPILLVNINDQEDLGLVHEVLQAHAYWRRRMLKIDLVIINQQGVDYGQELNSQVHRLISRLKGDAWLNRRGGIHLLLVDRIGEGGRVLVETAARAVLDGKRGLLSEQLERMDELPIGMPEFVPVGRERHGEVEKPLERPANLLFDNGYGGFSPDGKEYVVFLSNKQGTPSPWINVIANPDFGFIVSEAGSSCTWAVNSGENRLTPWRNDPVFDPSGEVLYLRDEETACIWSPTPQPAGDGMPYMIRHGAGYSIFEHHSQGLLQHTRLFVAGSDPVKVVHIRLENTWNHARRITATFFVEWTLGVSREAMQPFIIPEYHDESQALLVSNPYMEEFAERVAFAAASKPLHGLTADREEFLGRTGSYTEPQGLKVIGLSANVSPGLDPCAALQLHIELDPGQSEEIYFLLGQGANREDALALIQKYQQSGSVEQAYQDVCRFWDDLLGTVQVKTPDPAADLLLNRWLLYQTLSCRIWGRTAFYQSSGGYGFRDQLQDVMCLVHTAPQLAREHILRAAEHQFDAGDVLHWWHPPSGRGVRTRYSDDLLWLPFVTAYYVKTTGDDSILAESVPFLTGPMLDVKEKERYGLYESTRTSYPLLEHCRRALERGDTQGPHNLPLMGSGDWNDGMNRVGIEGRGESVWLGWFLSTTLVQFADLLESLGEQSQANIYRERAEFIVRAIEEAAWDGDWYLRAFYDDGTPLGSSKNEECQIDAIAQSWSVISGLGDPQRSRQAMDSVYRHLVKQDERLLLLFTPPFDKTYRDPGYIKGYPPGIRENGGQYTHAAIWTAWAFALLNQGDKAGELFRLLNPIYQADTPEKAALYRVEPFVIAADIYSIPPLVGNGGWTWYTGSSSWMYRLGIEAVLGLHLEGNTLRFDPCISSEWKEFQVVYRRGKSVYSIRIVNPNGRNCGISEVILDGEKAAGCEITLVDDGRFHHVQVVIGG